jgi:hypothetical protein
VRIHSSSSTRYIWSRAGVTYTMDLDWVIGFITPYTLTSYYRQYSAIAILHTLQFTVAHALGFSVFPSRILATDLSQTQWHFKSLEAFFAQSNFFLPLLCNCELNIIPSSSPARLESRTRLYSLLLYYTAEHFL